MRLYVQYGLYCHKKQYIGEPVDNLKGGERKKGEA